MCDVLLLIAAADGTVPKDQSVLDRGRGHLCYVLSVCHTRLKLKRVARGAPHPALLSDRAHAVHTLVDEDYVAAVADLEADTGLEVVDQYELVLALLGVGVPSSDSGMLEGDASAVIERAQRLGVHSLAVEHLGVEGSYLEGLLGVPCQRKLGAELVELSRSPRVLFLERSPRRSQDLEHTRAVCKNFVD